MKSAAQEFAVRLIKELIRLGVQDFIVSPGSRSQALALAAARAEELGLARLHVRLDERSAGFFGLGVGRESKRPAVVIVTSGTAVANLLPAVLEAHHSRVPLILLTADRPAELRGVRSNQTVADLSFMVHQTRVSQEVSASETFENLSEIGALARSAYRAAIGNDAPAGPAHLNIAFEEPLSAEIANDLLVGEMQDVQSDPGATFETAATYVHANDAPNTIVIAGEDSGPEAEEFAYLAGVPLLAEPSSGARFGREAIQHWDALLREETLQKEIGRVIVFGHPTLTRSVPAVIGREGIETIVVDPAVAKKNPGELYNPGRRVKEFVAQAKVAKDFDKKVRRQWLGAWVIADRELRSAHTTVHAPDLEKATASGYKERSEYAREEVARLRLPVTREHLVETTWLATWPHDRLVVASSRLVRVLNRQAAPRNITVYANRGLAGIDGTVATALGVAVASQTVADTRQAAGVTRLLIGDLAFLHDSGSLSLTPGEARPRIQIIIGNDEGGSIFEQLEVAETASQKDFDRVLRTPQKVSIASLAKAYGWEHRLIKNQGELERAFTEPVAGPEILEVLIEG